jgi:hypothetical protein
MAPVLTPDPRRPGRRSPPGESNEQVLSGKHQGVPRAHAKIAPLPPYSRQGRSVCGRFGSQRRLTAVTPAVCCAPCSDTRQSAPVGSALLLLWPRFSEPTSAAAQVLADSPCAKRRWTAGFARSMAFAWVPRGGSQRHAVHEESKRENHEENRQWLARRR